MVWPKEKKKKNPEKLVAKLFCRFGEIHDNHDNAWDILGGVEVSAFLLRKMIFSPSFLGQDLSCLLKIAWASLVAQMIKNLPAMQEMQVCSLG